MRAIDLYVNAGLPPDLRDNNRTLDKKNVEGLLAEVARRYPDQYSDITKHILDAGRHAVYNQGETLTLKDFEPVLDRAKYFKSMDDEIAQSDKTSKSKLEREQNRIGIWNKYSDTLEKATMEGAKNNNLGRSVRSGARGNALQLKAMLTTPALYTDYQDNPIPMFIRHSFAEGLRPAEYLASSYGTRKSVISTKVSTAKGGDFSKQLVAAAAPVVVSEHDCNTSNGLDFNVDDKNLHGRVLARTEGPYKAGTVLDKHTLRDLQKSGVKTVLARSPMTCSAHNGICASCLGQLPTGKFAHKGYMAGITAAQSVGEPITQSGLSAKHSGGATKGQRKSFSGFDVINQLVQSPETFPNKAVLSEQAGRVSSIDTAPQGGQYVTVGDHKHYVMPGFEPTVKLADEVEAGDPLSEGIADVSDVVRLRGLGEGRKYYVDRLSDAMDDSGYGRPTKANMEVLARATLNHAVVDDPAGMGSYLPDDMVSYQDLANSHILPKSAEIAHPDKAVGKYLHSGALHYTIGTKLTPKMVKHLSSAGVKGVVVSDEEPAFHPEMVRLRAAAHNNPDWLARMHSSYITTNLGDSAARARDTDTGSNMHFAPRLAVGKDFGKNIGTTGEF